MHGVSSEKPTALRLRKASRALEISYANGEICTLSWEFLRVHSPSAEVRGHGPGQETLQHGKLNVGVTAVRPVGHYAIQLVFDDGHDSGIYAWDYLRDLCSRQEELWATYLEQLQAAELTRDPDTQVIQFQP